MGTWIIREFSKEVVQMANKYVTKCSISLVIQKMQIKTTLRFHLTPIRVPIFKGNNNKCWQWCGKTGTLILLARMQINTTTMESSMEIAQKVKYRIAYDLVILILGIYWKDRKSGYNRDTCTMFTAALFIIIAKLWKKLGALPWWRDQENVVYIHNGVLLSHRNNDTWFENKWMRMEDILGEVSQAQKDKGHMLFLIHGR
jgi:hypothetical protein